MARPRADSNRISTPERILAAAELAFASAGFEARLSDIASEAGIRRPSLLYHFDSKEQLYAAVVTRAFARLGEALLLGRSVDGGFVTQLEQMTRAFVRFVDANPAVAQLVIRELLVADGPGNAILMGRVAPLLSEIERWIETQGAGHLRPGVPIRPAMLQVVSDVLLRSASGPMREPLWGDADEDRTWWMSQTLMLCEQRTSS